MLETVIAGRVIEKTERGAGRLLTGITRLCSVNGCFSVTVAITPAMRNAEHRERPTERKDADRIGDGCRDGVKWVFFGEYYNIFY